MTTIAWDGKTLAVDSKETCSGTVISTKAKKLYTDIGQYKAVAVCGGSADCQKIIEWIMQGEGKGVPSNLEDSAVIAIDCKGRAYKYLSPHLNKTKINPPYADGSGWEIALGAMDAGATAVEAVKIASKRDVYTGGRIRSYTHSDERKILRPPKVGSVSRAAAKKAVKSITKP